MASQERYGATPSDWAHFDVVLGLGQDLLPVVSNPNAVISPMSKMKALGKTPSRYNGQRQVGGIADWTSHVSTDAELERWAAEPDYGICLITRRVRAVDCDIGDATLAAEVNAFILARLGRALPKRTRSNSSKFLLLFKLEGDLPKQVIKTRGGAIELLGTGQQCLVGGLHTSGVRYEWLAGLPTEIPELTRTQLNDLLEALQLQFGIAPAALGKVSSKASKLAEAAQNDPTAVALLERGLVLGSESDGRVHITCPWSEDHTAGTGGESATTYWPANTGGFARGHFRCLHASHADKTDHDFLEVLGLAHNPADDFDVVEPSEIAKAVSSAMRYMLVPALEFKAGVPHAWHVKSVIPHTELVMVFGEPGSGKSFFTFDLVAAVARGIEWRGLKTKKGRVVYVVAEGASGFRNRIKAYCEMHDVDELDLYVLAATPDFMVAKDIIDLTNAIRALGDVAIVVIDTLARISAGANENSGEDMGLVIGHCSTIHQVTGATVLLIHHSGKNLERGARGWSGIKGALDAELEITRDDHNRTARVSKLKDGEGEGERFGFTLRTVPVGMDEDGDLVSSCVIEHGAAVAPKKKIRRLTENMERVWRALLDGQHVDGTSMTEEQLLDASEASFTPATRPKNLRRASTRALDSLCTMGKAKRVAPDLVAIVNKEAGQ